MRRQDVWFESAGERCAAWWYPPATGESPCAAVVLAHGFAGTRELRLDAYAERFAGAGLGALVFDYRHFGASGGEPRQLLDVPRQLEDWRAALAYVRAREDVDAGRVALWGTSYSGGHVVELAAADGGVAALVCQAPFMDGMATVRAAGMWQGTRLLGAGARDWLRARRGEPPLYVKAVGPPGALAAMTSPDAEPGYRALVPPGARWNDEIAARIFLQVAKYRPGRRARRLSCPLLVCVAEHDRVTPPRPAIRAARRAPRGELVTYPCGHFDPYLGELFERVVADQLRFLARHLLAPAPARAGAAALS